MRFQTTIILTLLLIAGAQSIRAQQSTQPIDPSTPPPPPPAETQPGPAAPTRTEQPARSQPIDPSTPPPPPRAETEPVTPTPAEPTFDPLHAEKDIEVGTFYMKKGDCDAAIDRYQEATRLQPALAKPWRLMGECYDKKHDDAHALASYKKYLEVFPRAEDADKVRKRIAALEEKIGPQAFKPASN